MMPCASAEWWRQAVVYQVRPPGPAVRDAAGLGDVRAVISRIPYLAALGIDAVWLSSLDPSALADDGYDGRDDRGGHPPRGALRSRLADFDEMTSALHAHGIKVIVDVVPDGPAFNFELLESSWDAGEFLRVITDTLDGPRQHGVGTTWVLSTQGADPRRARAATLLMLALPGSALLFQGEELGVPGAANIMPSVRVQEHDPGSTLNLHRQALGWRRKLQAEESLQWMPGTNGQVLHFGRPGGWRSVTNFGPSAVPLPPGTVVAASAPLESTPLDSGALPADTTAWILSGG
jgi:glycosidase